MSVRTLRLLIVDDEEGLRRSLRVFLEDEGFEVLTAASAEEGLQAVVQHDLDLALVDIRLPAMDGNAFMEHAHQLRPGLRFVICTGSLAYTPPQDLVARGVCQEIVFRKPLADLGVLSTAIRAILERSRSS